MPRDVQVYEQDEELEDGFNETDDDWEYEDSEDEFDKKQQDSFLLMCKDYGALDEDGNYPGFCSSCSSVSEWFLRGPLCLKDFSCDELKKHMPRLGVSILVWALGMYINNLSQAWLQKHVSTFYQTNWAPTMAARPPINTTVVLFDVGFEVLYATSTFPTAAQVDAYVTWVGYIALFRFIVLPGPLSLRWTILSRLMFMWGVLWCLRAFCIATTPLPNPLTSCVPDISYPDNIFLEAWAILPFSFCGKQLTCQDVMFSGHTVALTLPMLAVFKYTPLAPWFQISASRRWCSISTLTDVLGTFILFFGYYIIVASHFHYTVDVLVGATFTLLVFNAYHYQVRVSMLRGNRGSCQTKFWMWFEHYSLDLVGWRRRAKEHLEADFVDGVLE